jgi:hypothetical protein
MLGKQWLNRYASTDKRGSAIERSQNRQRKLDGIVVWYFDSVMESLPLMLQAALLLLGCALSRYLWEVSITIASVVLGVTSFGVLLYFFIVIAGAAFESCPYQTPGSHTLRHLGAKVWGTARSAASALVSAPSAIDSTLRNTFKKSKVIKAIKWNVRYHRSWRPRGSIMHLLRDLVHQVPPAFATDVRRLGQATIRALSTLPVGAYRLVRRLYGWLHHVYFIVAQMGRQTTALDLRCISWTVRTSLDKTVHLSTLEHLATILELTYFDPSLVEDCLGIFAGCINVSSSKVVVAQGSEQLVIASATSFFRTFRHLSVMDPTSSVLTDLRRRYHRILPLTADFRGLPFFHTMTKIHALVNQDWNPRHIRWRDYSPSAQEVLPFSRHMVEVAQVEYQRTQQRKMPCWILRSALYYLTLDPPPPAPVIADCLKIIAIDLGCDVQDTTTLDERCVYSNLMRSTVLIKDQCTSGTSLNPRHPETRDHD